MQKQLNALLFSAIFLLATGAANAQTPVPFWSEDFSDGIPAGWTTNDASNQGLLWTWCPDPTAGNTNPGCSPIFDDGLNLQEPFKATTSANGFMTCDSDQAGQLPGVHKSRLTTSVINCSGKSQVFLTFQTHAGVFQPNDQMHMLQISTNGTTFSNVGEVFPDLTIAIRWSDNPERPVIDLSSVAANQPTVYLRWEYTGLFEYFWNIDDVEVYDQNPAARFDVSMTNFFYSPINFATPASQFDTMEFAVTLTNDGLEPMTNVWVVATVEDTVNNVLLFADSTKLNTLDPGVLDSFVVLDKLYTTALPVGEYLVSYKVRADSTDQRPLDNSGASPFLVSNSIFSKEAFPQTTTRPATAGPWSVGNYYRMNEGVNDAYKAVTARFAFDTDENELPIADVAGTVYLFRVKNTVPDDFSGFAPTGGFTNHPGLTWIGYANYEAPDDIVGGAMQEVNLVTLSDGLGVPLTAGDRLFLMIGYPSDAQLTNHAFNRNIKYPFDVSTITYSTQWFLGGFGDDWSAVMRLTISLASTTDEKELPESVMSVFPNPVKDALSLAVQFDQPTDATITIAEIDGRVIDIDDRQGLTQEQLNYPLPQLASGVYLVRIATKEGTKTKRFVVQK